MSHKIPFSTLLVLAEGILNILPATVRVLMKPAPNLHQLLPVALRLLRRHEPLRRNAILLYHFHNLSRQLAARLMAAIPILFLGLLGWDLFRQQLQDLRRHIARVCVCTEDSLRPPVLLLRRHVAGRDDALVWVNEPECDEASVAWFGWVLEFEGGNPVMTI